MSVWCGARQKAAKALSTRNLAPYSLAGNAIEIGRAASTRKACTTPPGIMEQEAAYLAALGRAAAYRIEDNRLILETAAGNPVANFVSTAGRRSREPGED